MNWVRIVDDFESHYEVYGSLFPLSLVPANTSPLSHSSPRNGTSKSIGNDDTVFYLRTNADAPRYKIISVDLNDFVKATQEASANGGKVHIKDVEKVLVAEDEEALLEHAVLVGDDRLVLTYQHNVGISQIYGLISGNECSFCGHGPFCHR